MELRNKRHSGIPSTAAGTHGPGPPSPGTPRRADADREGAIRLLATSPCRSCARRVAGLGGARLRALESDRARPDSGSKNRTSEPRGAPTRRRMLALLLLLPEANMRLNSLGEPSRVKPATAPRGRVRRDRHGRRRLLVGAGD